MNAVSFLSTIGNPVKPLQRHVPCQASERWLSEGEARRDALEYAVKLIDSGVLDELRASRDRAA